MIERKDTEDSKSLTASGNGTSGSGSSDGDPTEPTTNEEQPIQLRQLHDEGGRLPARGSQEADTPSGPHSAQAASVSGQDTLDGVDGISHEPENSCPRRVDTEMNRSIASAITRARLQDLGDLFIWNFHRIARDKSPKELRDYLYEDSRILIIMITSIDYFLIFLFYHVELGTGVITSAVIDNPLEYNSQ